MKLYQILDDPSGRMIGVYAKGEPSKESVIDAIKQEYPWFIDDLEDEEINIDDLVTIPCYVRMVPANDDSGFGCYYHETGKGRGAMKVVRFSV